MGSTLCAIGGVGRNTERIPPTAIAKATTIAIRFGYRTRRDRAQSMVMPAALIGVAFLAISLATKVCR
jgi:hypothetical protein